MGKPKTNKTFKAGDVVVFTAPYVFNVPTSISGVHEVSVGSIGLVVSSAPGVLLLTTLCSCGHIQISTNSHWMFKTSVEVIGRL